MSRRLIETANEVIDDIFLDRVDTQMIKKIALVTQKSFELIGVDSGHNFENHAIPVLKNTVALLEEINYKGPYTNELLCAALLHDRSRVFFGHLPIKTLQRAIMKSVGLDNSFQDIVLEVISTHSNLEQHEPYKQEKIMLFLADKLEFANWDRAENALKTMPTLIVNFYKNEWVRRIPTIEKKVLEYRDLCPNFVASFEEKLKYSKIKMNL